MPPMRSKWSWYPGVALYTKSQQLAYHDPYMEMNPHIKIVNDDASRPRRAAKIRAQAEAGNVTWDLVDVVAV